MTKTTAVEDFKEYVYLMTDVMVNPQQLLNPSNFLRTSSRAMELQERVLEHCARLDGLEK